MKTKEPGILLEYSIFDTTKIEFVKNILCDTLNDNQDIVFEKQAVIINDSTYYFYTLRKRMYVEFDYIGMLYFDAENLDTFSMYTYDWKFTIDDFDSAVKAIYESNQFSKEELFKRKKIGNYYVPDIFFNIEVNSMKCESGFLEKVVQADRKINLLLKNYVQKEFPDENILVKPRITIQLKI